MCHQMPVELNPPITVWTYDPRRSVAGLSPEGPAALLSGTLGSVFKNEHCDQNHT